MQRFDEAVLKDSPFTGTPSQGFGHARSKTIKTTCHRRTYLKSSETFFTLHPGDFLLGCDDEVMESKFFHEFDTFGMLYMYATFDDANRQSRSRWDQCLIEKPGMPLHDPVQPRIALARKEETIKTLDLDKEGPVNVTLFCGTPTVVNINEEGEAFAHERMVSTKDSNVNWWGFSVKSAEPRTLCVTFTAVFVFAKTV